jgi:RimJ/RimL family protein N-acetyltransferase
LDVEVVTSSALRAAIEEAPDRPEREHVTPFVYRRPERFRLAALRTGLLLGDERWTVDTQEDLDVVRGIVERLAPRTDFGWEEALAVWGRRADRSGLRLRPATESDRDLLLQLRNDPDAVRFARTGRPVTEDQHGRWLRSRLDTPSTRLWVAEDGGRPVGQVRVDVTNGAGLVSVAVARDSRGQGYAGRMLTLLQDALRADFQVRELEAEIHVDNHASRLAFERAGFTPVGEEPPFSRWRWARPA